MHFRYCEGAQTDIIHGFAIANADSIAWKRNSLIRLKTSSKS